MRFQPFQPYSDMVKQLLEGYGTAFRQTGNGMLPLIRPGQHVVIAPVRGYPPRHPLVAPDEIVFCKQNDRWCLRVADRIKDGLIYLRDGRGAPCGLTTHVAGVVCKVYEGLMSADDRVDLSTPVLARVLHTRKTDSIRLST